MVHDISQELTSYMFQTLQDHLVILIIYFFVVDCMRNSQHLNSWEKENNYDGILKNVQREEIMQLENIPSYIIDDIVTDL